MRILIISADNFEDIELFYPLYRLTEEKADIVVASMKKGEIRGKHGYSINIDLSLQEINPKEFDMLVLPGGEAPEKIRLDEKALEITKHFFDENKPVAAICHGAQILISAGVIKGRKATCYIGIRDDLKSAGAYYDDNEVVVDENLVTSRKPNDLPAFSKQLVLKLQKGRRTKDGISLIS